MPARGTATNRQLRTNAGLASGRRAASGRLNIDGSGGGGGGADLTPVTSLPPPGSADPTKMYHLSKDDFTYILNNAGTALVPIHLPGWSRNDGANDDEWEGSNVDPPAGWTWDNQDTTTVNTNNTYKSNILLIKSNTANKLAALYKNVPASPTGKTFYCLFQWAADNKSTVGNSAVGMVARNNSNGRLIFYYLLNSGVSPLLVITRWADSSTPGITAFTAAVTCTFIPGIYGVLGFTYDGTNLIFKYAPQYNGAFENLVSIHTESIAGHLLSFDAFGLGIFNNGSVVTTLLSDWIRVV